MADSQHTIRYSISICGDEDEERELLEAYIAGRKAAGASVDDSYGTEVIGPDAPNAPLLAAWNENTEVEITIPTFDVVSGVTYTLYWSDDNWASHWSVSDVTSGTVAYSAYAPGRAYRVEATRTDPSGWSAGSASSLTIP